MDVDAAYGLLGIKDSLNAAEVERAYAMRRAAAEARLSTAPTEALKSKYRQALAEIDLAHRVVLAVLRPSVPSLSSTQLGDLPSAHPIFTQSGFQGTDVAASNPALERIQSGHVLALRYEIRERIGLGGMGAVYRAFDRNRNEEIAVKVLLPHLLSHPAARERFVAEAKIASSLSHPNIVNVFDVQRDGNFDFLTMELLGGQTLRQLMSVRKAARRPFTVAEALEVGRAIGEALAYAHKQTVHRDVKPENVWVDDDGSYKLMDFGIARLLSTSQLTATTTAMGTAYYMAPEQLKSAKSVDGRADQYAMAVMLYELISGEIPAGRIKPLRQLRKDVPHGLSNAIDRGLEPDPAARFANMAEFLRGMSSRGTRLSAVVLRSIAIVAAVGVLSLVVALVGPQLVSLMPDRAGEERARTAAIQAEGVIETLIKRIEVAERELESEVRDARSTADRYDGMVRMARSEEERRELQLRLTESSGQLALVTEVRDLASTWVFQSSELAKLRGTISLGTTALRDGRFVEAAQVLGTAQAVVETLLDVPDAARAAIAARDIHGRAMESIRQIAQREKKDVSPFVAQAEAIAAQAASAFREGRFRDAASAYSAASREVGGARTSMIDELVSAYGGLAKRAMDAKRLSDAEVAIARAKELSAMKTAPH